MSFLVASGTIAATTAAAGAGVLAAGVGVAGALGAFGGGGPDAPPPRNLGNELSNIGGQFDQFSNRLTGGTGNFQQSGLTGLQGLLRGNTFDPQAFMAAHGDISNNWNNDPTYQQLYGTLDNYAYNSWYNTQDPQFLTNGLGSSLNTLNTENRLANINDVASLSGQYANIIRGNNQPYYNQLGNFTAAANAPIQQSASQQQAANQAQNGYAAFNYNPSAIQQGQNYYAMQALANGGNLSPSELRNVQQSSRAGFAARGLDATNASIVDEAMQTDAAHRARLMQNLGIASNAQNQGFNEYGTQLGGYNANLNNQNSQQAALMGSAQLAEQQRQAQLAAMAQATSLQAQGRVDPYAAILGGTNDQSGAALGFYGTNQNAQNSLLASLLGYGSDLNNTNYNANAAANIAGYNGQQALNGSLISAGTNLLGSYLGASGGAAGGGGSIAFGNGGASGTVPGYAGTMAPVFCWVAREVYGEDNPEWLEFRNWIMNRAPDAFREFYQANGEQIAERIKGDDAVKTFIRYLMDSAKSP